MSYRPQYKNDQQQMVDLPLDAETVKGQAINSSAVANTIPVRDGNGNVKTNTPISDTDATNKAYVDSKKVQIFRYNGFISYESGSDYALDIGNVVKDGRTVQIGDIIINSELVGGYVTRQDDTFIFIKVVFNGNAYSLNGKNASDFTPADYSYSKADSDNKYATKSEVNAKYTKPNGGIPKSDLAQAVQTSLGKADTALQSAPVSSVNGLTGAVNLTTADAKVISGLAFDKNFGKTSGNIVGYRIGDLVVISVVFTPGSSGVAWRDMALATGLPLPRVEGNLNPNPEYVGMCMPATPCALSADGITDVQFNLRVYEGSSRLWIHRCTKTNGAKVGAGIEFKGTIVYVCQ